MQRLIGLRFQCPYLLTTLALALPGCGQLAGGTPADQHKQEDSLPTTSVTMCGKYLA
jgi:hypothetical protein